jgi:hypothetical protein
MARGCAGWLWLAAVRLVTAYTVTVRHRRPAGGRTPRVIRMAWVAWGSPGQRGGDLQAAELHAVVNAVTGAVGDGDLAPGQAGQLMVQRGLVGLHDQQVSSLRRCGVPAPAVGSGQRFTGVQAGSW